MENNQSSIGVVLYPSKLGQLKAGVDECPDQLLGPLKSLVQQRNLDMQVYDSPKIRELNKRFGDPDKENLVFQANLDLRESVCQSLKTNAKTLNLGGDHSMGFGTVSGFLKAYPSNSRVVWIDAHADMNTRKSSPSNNYHGMPLSFMLGFDEDKAFPMPTLLDYHHLTYIGIRDLDEFEEKTIAELKINKIEPKDLQDVDGDKIRQFVRDFIGTEKTVHISWDVDSTDPSTEIGATGTPVNGGITCEHVKEFIRAIGELNVLVSMDVTELNLNLAKTEQERQRSLEKTLDVIEVFLDCH